MAPSVPECAEVAFDSVLMDLLCKAETPTERGDTVIDRIPPLTPPPLVAAANKAYADWCERTLGPLGHAPTAVAVCLCKGQTAAHMAAGTAHGGAVTLPEPLPVPAALREAHACAARNSSLKGSSRLRSTELAGGCRVPVVARLQRLRDRLERQAWAPLSHWAALPECHGRPPDRSRAAAATAVAAMLQGSSGGGALVPAARDRGKGKGRKKGRRSAAPESLSLIHI